MERDGLRHATLPKTRNMRMKTTQRIIPDRSSPGPRTASSVSSLAGSTRTEVENMLLADQTKPSVPETRSRIMTIRLKAANFNITIIQAYAPTTDHEDEEVKDFYNEVQKTLNEVPKKDIIVVQSDWNAKIGEDAQEDWEGTCGQYCNSGDKRSRAQTS
ncbi:craniofacial development protein 2 [Plakobranchus ocellatus]|uniref:Craniofacial development protein 2 n=1 Tax=Plakobranchus ocellatus TaxID=259542 RepID=A0AAV3ZRQ8_9GAST|nr:craniofacial development protein 2 [Plakobranchus ocellatus]